MAQVEEDEAVVYSRVGAEFFAEAIEKWEEIWAPRAPMLAELRRVAEETR